MGVVFIVITNVFIGIIATWAFELILQKNRRLRERYYRRHEVLFGYHVHHSTVGLLLVAAGIVLWLLNKEFPSLVALGLGVGVIIMHTISSGRFVFVEKENF